MNASIMLFIILPLAGFGLLLLARVGFVLLALTSIVTLLGSGLGSRGLRSSVAHALSVIIAGGSVGIFSLDPVIGLLAVGVTS